MDLNVLAILDATEILIKLASATEESCARICVAE